jgi:O-antigen/teichoic acid export membrane protein
MDQAWTKYLPAAIRVKVDGKAYLQNVLSNTGWQFADSILRMLVGLSVGVWLARYLGPEQFGLLNYAMAFGVIFSALATLGLDDIVIRNIVRDPASKDETLGTAFCLKLFGGAAAFLGAMAAIFLLRPADTLSHWLVGIIAAGMIFQAFTAIDFWFYSQIQAKFSVVAKNLAFLFCSAIKVVLILVQASLLAFAWVALFEIVIGSLGLIIAYKTTGNHFSMWQVSLQKARGLLRDSWPLIISGIAVTIYMRIDQIMLGQMIGSEEVGVYSVAVRLAEVWNFIPLALYGSLFPAIVEAKKLGEQMFYDRMQQFYNLLILCAYAVAVPITVLSGWLVTSIFGEAYSSAGLMLAILVWAGVFTSLEVGRFAFIAAMNWTRVYLVTVLLGGFLNVALNYFLIPVYGGTGAAAASLFSYWFATHGACVLFKPLNRTGIMMSKALLYPKIW